jgi:enoyl-CoA hydratase/carnithine racemase
MEISATEHRLGPCEEAAWRAALPIAEETFDIQVKARTGKRREAKMTEHVRREIADGIMTLTIARPDKKNALSNAMYSALSDGLELAEREPSVRVVLFQGEGDSFTAGNDLADFRAASNEQGGPSEAFRFIGNLGRATKPLVAAVHGNAVGVGTTMLLHCDLVYLAEDAKLITPFVNLALVPEAASSWLLPSRIGHVRAYAMFALGEPMDAVSALSCGLANAVVPATELRAQARRAAETLAKRPAGALSQTKALMRETERIASQINRESGLFRERLQSAEAREAFAAFAERRQPDFSKLAS